MAKLDQAASGLVLLLLRAAHRRDLIAVLGGVIDQAGHTREALPAVMEAGTGQEERLALVSSRGELMARLQAARVRLNGNLPARLTVPGLGMFYGAGGNAGRVAFLFPGQGSQHPGMLRDWTAHMPGVRAWFDCLDTCHLRLGYAPPSELIYGPDSDLPAQKQALMDIGRGAQLGTVANLALWEVLNALGLKPDCVLGYSNGEHAAVMGSYLRLRQHRELICDWLCRTSRMGLALGEPPSPEGMVAVSGFRREALDAMLAPFARDVFLAMDNCPHQLVLAGRRRSLDQVVACVHSAGGICANLPLRRAYHTPWFESWAHVLRIAYDSLPLSAPNVPVVSCRNGEVLPADPMDAREAMASQWMSTIHFRNTILKLHAEGVNTFVEVGPDNKLTAFVEDTLRGHPHLAVSTAPPQRGYVECLCRLLAVLHAGGLPVNGHGLIGLLPSIPKPGAPAAEPRHVAAQHALIEATRASLERASVLFQGGSIGTAPSPVPGALLGQTQCSGLRLTAHKRFHREEHDLVRHHCLGRWPGALAVLPFTLTLELAAEAARTLGAPTAIILREARAHRWLALDHSMLNLRVLATRDVNTVNVTIEDDSGYPGPAFQVRADIIPAPAAAPPPMLAPAGTASPRGWTVDRFYREYAFHGPAYRALRRVSLVGPDWISSEAVSCVSQHDAGGSWVLDPAMLDCAGQLVAFWMLDYVGRKPTFGIFPYTVREVIAFGPPPKPGEPITIEGHVEQIEAQFTQANFDFRTSSGRPLASLRGFAQRLIELPAAVAGWLLHGAPVPFSTAGRGDSALVERWLCLGDWTGLLDSWGIWHRAVAHLALTANELAHWKSLAAKPETQLHWLLSRLLVKEAVREAAERGGDPVPAYPEITLPESPDMRIESKRGILSIAQKLETIRGYALACSTGIGNA